jgi:hypothetical protein
MILNANPVQTAGLDFPGSVEQRVGSVGDEEISERQVAAVVGHCHTLSREHEPQHQIIRSIEPDEDWLRRYADETMIRQSSRSHHYLGTS